MSRSHSHQQLRKTQILTQIIELAEQYHQLIHPFSSDRDELETDPAFALSKILSDIVEIFGNEDANELMPGLWKLLLPLIHRAIRIVDSQNFEDKRECAEFCYTWPRTLRADVHHINQQKSHLKDLGLGSKLRKKDRLQSKGRPLDEESDVTRTISQVAHYMETVKEFPELKAVFPYPYNFSAEIDELPVCDSMNASEWLELGWKIYKRHCRFYPVPQIEITRLGMPYAERKLANRKKQRRKKFEKQYSKVYNRLRRECELEEKKWVLDTMRGNFNEYLKGFEVSRNEVLEGYKQFVKSGFRSRLGI